MENSCLKKYKQSPKKWILASRRTGLRRNSALVPANAGLFHYAGNNPVRYIDPDGREGFEYDFWNFISKFASNKFDRLTAECIRDCHANANTKGVNMAEFIGSLSKIHYADGQNIEREFKSPYFKTDEINYKLDSSLLIAVGCAMPRGAPGPSDYDGGKAGEYAGQKFKNLGTVVGAFSLAGFIIENFADGMCGDVIMNVRKRNNRITEWNITLTVLNPMDDRIQKIIMTRDKALEYLKKYEENLRYDFTIKEIDDMLN